MDSREAIKINLDMASMVCGAYLEDLTTEDLMQRPHPGCNHIIWQLGHLISAEHNMMEQIAPGSMPALPDGFADRYTKETTSSDDPSGFDSKEELLELAQAMRAATIESLSKKTDEELATESPEGLRNYAATVAAAYSLQGSHWMMHAGQWVIVRRELGRPVVI